MHGWQVSDYSSGSENAKDWIYKSSEYAKATQGSVQTAFLDINGVLNVLSS